MTHIAGADFWSEYRSLPVAIRARADKQFSLLKSDPQHPSLQFKKIGHRRGKDIWSVRVTLRYRALAIRRDNECIWFWIGEHAIYDAMLS